jgi:serine/threonine-protein kinase
MMIGTTVSHYRITSKLGEGGMGEVYLAEDTRLERRVALKVLPSEVAADPDRLARFEREAKTISQLSHSHICTLHDVGQEGDVHFLVMEYLEGESLADRLQKGKIPVDEALRYSIEIAGALDAAHRRGVVHRDLKPGNIMLARDGAKLLDFGLAKLEAPSAVVAESLLATEDKPLTAEGTLLGTFQYMAPEQLEGKEADARTDIFAFGTTVYEMLTGRKAFQGESHASLIAAIISSEPPAMTEPQPLTPPALERVVRRCLAKDPEQRWHSAHDVTLELNWIAETDAEGKAGLGAAAAPAGRRGARTVPMTLAAVITLAAAGAGALGAWLLRPSSSAEVGTTARFVMTLPAEEVLVSPWSGSPIALSPDGTRLAYLADVDGVSRLHLRAMDSLEARPLPGTDGARAPSFSPDGEWLGFVQGHAIRKIPVAGGEPVTVCDECVPNPRGLTWGPNDTIVFTPTVDTGGVWAVSADGGAPHPLTQVDPDAGETNHRWAQLLPRGEALLFTAGGEGNWGNSVIVVQRLDSGERKTLVRGATYGRYLPTGHLVYLRHGTLLAAPFDPTRLALGAEVRVAEGISQNPSSGAPRLGLSDAGVLVYVTDEFGAALDVSSLVWVDRNGAVQPLGAPPRPYGFPQLSPEGERVAVGIKGARAAVWVYDIPSGSLDSLTFESDGASSIPAWAGGGDRIAFVSGPEEPRNLYWKAADFSDPAQRLTESRNTHDPSSASRDGKWLAYTEFDPASPGNGDLVVLSLEGDPTPQPFLRTPFFEGGGMFSPDGKWIAYTSNESGSYEVYVRPFSGPGEQRLMSAGAGGQQPVWARDGRELFFLANDRRTLMAVDVTTRPALTTSRPRRLLEFERMEDVRPPIYSMYDISPDGQRFLFVQTNEPPREPTPLVVVLNWFEELKRRVPTE